MSANTLVNLVTTIIPLKLKVSLYNFKCFAEKIVKVSNSFVLLNGPSGSGKTTVLQAIVFALTGDGKGLIKFGGKTCKVVLEIDAMTIARTKCPNNLKVTIYDPEPKTYEDKVAQHYIDECFDTEFIKFSYVAQNTYGFLSMSPQDRFKLVRMMVLDETRLETVKKKAKALKTDRQRLYNVQLGKVAAFGAVEKCKGPVNAELYPDPRTAKLAVEKELEEVSDSIKKIESDNKFIETVLSRINQLTEYDEQELEVEASDLRKLKRFLGVANKGNLYSSTDVAGFIDALEAIPYKLLFDEKKQKETLLQKITKEVKTMIVRTVCPNCKSSVIVKDDFELVKDHENHKDDILAKTKGWVNCWKLHKQLTSQIAVTTDSISKLDSQLAEFNVPDSGTLDVLDDCSDDLVSLYETYPEDVPQDIWAKFKTINEIDKRLAALTTMGKQNKEKQSLSVLTLPKFIDPSIELARRKALTQKMIDLKAAENDKSWHMKRGAEIAQQLHGEALGRSVALVTLLAEAETHHIKAKLLKINILINRLIYNMTSGTISVCLVPELLGNTSTAQKLKIVVFNRGQETDHSTLSGGETSRLNIALAIALVKLKKVPFIVLDEATSSLDQETTELVLRTVRSEFSGTILCVAHQAVTGMFEDVLEFDGQHDDK